MTRRQVRQVNWVVGVLACAVLASLLATLVHVYAQAGGSGVPADLSTLTTNDIDALSVDQLRPYLAIYAAGTRSDEFSVVWTGSVQAPYNGAYTFSICPIDTNCDSPQLPTRQGMTVTVGGQQVIQAGPGNWVSEGPPVSLQAGVKSPLRVEFSFKGHENPIPWRFPAIAQLWWQGPGVTKQLLSGNVLWTPDGTKNGLQAQYSLTVNGQQQTATVTEPSIDHLWVKDVPQISAYPELCSHFAARVTALATATDYLATLENSPTTPHFMLQTEYTLDLMAPLDSTQRTAVTEALLARPATLQAVSMDTICALYGFCRISDPDTALRLLGQWAQMHPEGESAFCMDMYVENDSSFHTVGYATAQQYPPHLALLESNYLVLPDGSCSLPVAYSVASGYAVHGPLADWVEKLDAHLSDQSITGDQRVSWLLARAWVEEMLLGAPSNYYWPMHRFLAGYDWLAEACLTAQSEPVRLRAYKEIAVRLAADEQFDAARQQLDKAAQQCSSSDSVAKLAAWRQEIDQVANTYAQRHVQDAALSQQAYWTELLRRYHAAVDAGNQAAVSQYEQTFRNAGIAF